MHNQFHREEEEEKAQVDKEEREEQSTPRSCQGEKRGISVEVRRSFYVMMMNCLS